MRVACELGKYPDEVMEWMTPQWVTRWCAYFAMQRPDEKKPEDIEQQFGLTPRG